MRNFHCPNATVLVLAFSLMVWVGAAVVVIA